MRLDPNDKKISDQVEALVGMAEEDYGFMTAYMLTTMLDLFGSKE